MKKIIAVAAILLVLAAAFMMGRHHGIQHAIHDSTLFVVDLPDRNQYGGFDEDEFTVYLEIDGDVHEYGAYIC